MDDPQDLGPLERPGLSYSQGSRIRDCSWRWYLERVCGHLREQVPTWAMVAGSAVHLATENIDREAIGQGTGGPITFTDAFDACIEREEELCGFDRLSWKATGRKTKALPHGRDYDWWLTEGQRQVNSWQRWVSTSALDPWFAPDGKPGIELPLDTVRRGVVTKGSADRVFRIRGTDDLIVVDIKTGRCPATAEQLGDYADAIERIYGVEVKYGSFWLGATGVVDDIHDLDMWTGRLTETMYDMAAQIIENGLFAASPGMTCSYCGVREYCYAAGMFGPDVPLPSELEENAWRQQNVAA